MSTEKTNQIIIKKIVTGELKTNCYIIATNLNNCLIFDPGSNFEKINDYIIKNNLNPLYIFLTHGHYDHIGAVPQFKSTYPQINIAISEPDKDCLLDGNKSLAHIYGNYEQQPINNNITIKNNSTLKIDNINIKCFLTPGHTLGSTCYLINNSILLTGDTIFKNSVGRTDLYGGNQSALETSIKNLYNLLKPSQQNSISIYPGHWLSSTLEKELMSNPHLTFLNI